MSPEAFHELALRVIAREASDDDRRLLDAEFAANPARRGEFAELAATFGALRTTAPMAEAVRTEAPELPAHRLNELRTAVRQHFGPAAARTRETRTPLLFLRWLLAGGAATVLAAAVVLICFSNSAIEIGLYRTDLSRGGAGIVPENVPAAQVVSFDGDAAFDAWQHRPLAWYEHAKIWVDDEHNLLHVIRRVKHGEVQSTTVPLASTDEAQREQIRQAVQGSQK